MKIDTAPRLGLCLAVVVCLCVMTGCSDQYANEIAQNNGQRETMPFTSLTEVKLELNSNSGPAIIEFAQDFNCSRCDQMASTMSDLRAGFSKDVRFHRVNYLSANHDMKLGLCPTYLLMLDGQVVDQLSGKQPYPILASRLDELVAVHNRKTEQQTNPSGMELENDTNQEH